MRPDLLSDPIPLPDAPHARVVVRPPQRDDGVPALRRALRGGLSRIDTAWWRLSSNILPERPRLVAVALHSLCSTRSQVDDPALAPNQNVSVADFRNLVDTVLQAGYTAVSPSQVVAGLAPGGKYVMFTFDDGYFNNVMALDVLEEFEVPGTFFISSNHVLEGKAFWWDALNRALLKSGATEHQRNVEIARTKSIGAERIDEYLRDRFGLGALRPHGDGDRPFTRDELTSFAQHRWVHLGNHTCDHAILTGCPPQEIERQIRQCQDALTQIAGYPPLAISYPNGDHSAAVVRAALAAGLRIGLTVQPRDNRLPLPEGEDLMKLGRFYFYGDSDPREELLKWRAGVLPSHWIKRVVQTVR